MGLLQRFRQYQEKRQLKAEDRTIHNVANANDKIKLLETRKKALEERERVFRQQNNLENDVKVREQAVKDMEYRKDHPIMSRLQDNIKKKLSEAQKQKPAASVKQGVKKVANSSSGYSPFTGSSDSQGFVKHITSSFDNPIYGKTSASRFVGHTSPFAYTAARRKVKRKGKTIVIKL